MLTVPSPETSGKEIPVLFATNNYGRYMTALRRYRLPFSYLLTVLLALVLSLVLRTTDGNQSDFSLLILSASFGTLGCWGNGLVAIVLWHRDPRWFAPESTHVRGWSAIIRVAAISISCLVVWIAALILDYRHYHYPISTFIIEALLLGTIGFTLSLHARQHHLAQHQQR